MASSPVAPGKIRIKVESDDSEIYVDVRVTYKVKDLLKIVLKAWGDGDEYVTFHYGKTLMENDQPLSAYNIKQDSVVKVNFYVDSP